MTVFLKSPLQRIVKDTGEVVSTIDSVTVSKLKTGQLLTALDIAGNKQGSLMRHLISMSTRLTHEEVDRLDIEDFTAISAEMEGFLPTSLQTGGTGSNSSQEPSGSQPATSGGDTQN